MPRLRRGLVAPFRAELCCCQPPAEHDDGRQYCHSLVEIPISDLGLVASAGFHHQPQLCRLGRTTRREHFRGPGRRQSPPLLALLTLGFPATDTQALVSRRQPINLDELERERDERKQRSDGEVVFKM